MSHGVSTYRSIASALVATLVLLLGAGGPTLVHLCTMDGAPAAMEKRADVSKAPPCHDGMDMGNEGPVDEQAPAEPCSPVMQVCCLSVTAVSSEHAVVAEATSVAAPVLALVAMFVPETAAPHRAPEPRDTGPPAVRSHLAFSVLLI